MKYESYDTIETNETKSPIKEESSIYESNEFEKGLVVEHIGTDNKVGDSNECLETIIGTPEKDMENWHLQDGKTSCAVCCQEFVAEQLLGKEFSESQFVKIAEKNGWFNPETGTSLSDVGKILEGYGLTVNREFGATLNDLAEDLKSGSKPICAVNSGVLDNPKLARIPGTKADHAVQVIGIDVTDPKDIKIILNDPGVSEGKGRIVSADTFVKAWNKGRNFVASVSKEA